MTIEIDLNPYQYVTTVDITEACLWATAGCWAIDAIAFADGPEIPDEIPVTEICLGLSGGCTAEAFLDYYGDAICENPSFRVYSLPWWLIPTPAPNTVLIPEC